MENLGLNGRRNWKIKKFNSCRRIHLSENKNFPNDKLVVKVEEEKKEMHNLMLFQTVTN